MFLTLIFFLLLASWFDIRQFRIPNILTVPAAIAGLSLSAYAGNGLLFSLAGGGIGLVLFMAPYALGKMGAGDVKMLAAAGTFLGPVGVIWAALWSLIAGGVLAVLWVWYLKMRPAGAYVPDTARLDEGKKLLGSSRNYTAMPYGLAIAIGTLIALF